MSSPSRNPSLTFEAPVSWALPALVIALTFLNGFYNSMASALGYGFPYNTFCFMADDLFADFVKATLSFPGPAIERLDSWPALYREYLHNNPYVGAEGLAQGKLTNLHGMPFPTLILLVVRRAIAFLDPNLAILATFTATIAPFCLFIWSYARRANAGPIVVAAFLLSYPLILAVTRGNITAIMLGEALVAAILLSWERRNPWVVALLLALAINLRPNAIIFAAVPLIDWSLRQTIAYAIGMAVFAVGIFLAALAAANALYPDYSVANFMQAIVLYRKFYALGDAGLAYGSSLFGGLKMLTGFFREHVAAEPFELPVSMLGALFGLAWLLQVWRRRLEPLSALFCLISIYALFSGVFGDYHLIVFIAPLIIIATSGESPFATNRPDLSAMGFAVAMMLAPKNYIFIHDLSAQVILNPFILISVVFAIFHNSFNENRLMEPATLSLKSGAA